MAHICEFCGEMCYCDMDDICFPEMPMNCPHWSCDEYGCDADDEDISRLPEGGDDE